MIRSEIKRRHDTQGVNKLIFYDKYNDFLIFEGRTLSQTLSVLFAILDFNRNLDFADEQ